MLGPVPWVGASPHATGGMAQPEGGDTGTPVAPPAVGAGYSGAVGSTLADPLNAAGPRGVLRAHPLGIGFTRPVIEESIGVWYAHAKARAVLLKARLGPCSTMEWVLQQLRLHQQAEREGV